MISRTTNKWARERPVTRHCEVPDCGVATRAGKPFCSNHVEKHPYIQELLHIMMDSEIEEARVRQIGPRAVAADGLNSLEIVRFVRVNGERTVPRLARDLNMDLPTLEAYVKALKRRRLIRLGKNKRGTPLISLPQPKRTPKPAVRAKKKTAAAPAQVMHRAEDAA